MNRSRKTRIALAVMLIMAATAHAASPQNWVTTIDAATYGSTGTITFNDWGYKGPTGVGANDFQVGSGFNGANIGQIQQVVTKSPDWKTPDAPQSVARDNIFAPPYTYTNASMDGQVNFFQWAYTTPAGSTFNNMQIDKAGNYHVAKGDMHFGYYDTFQYHDATGVNPDSSNPTSIGFQPYAISDARGWCGSVLVTNPNGVAAMAGQVTFDFAFDAYLFGARPGPGVIPATQIVPGFVMRSYGSYDVNVTTADGVTNQHFTGSAVMNNTNPVNGQLDPAFQNQVSFLGGGVVPQNVCVLNDGTPNVQIVACGSPGATIHHNTFGGYAFLLRADANRTLQFIDPSGHSFYVATDPAAYASLTAVPVPGAGWLLGSGLVGLIGWARRQGNRATAQVIPGKYLHT